MADRIVVTEELAANMTESCCVFGDVAEKPNGVDMTEKHLRGVIRGREELPVTAASSGPYRVRRDAWEALAQRQKLRTLDSRTSTTTRRGTDSTGDDAAAASDDDHADAHGSDDAATDDLMPHCEDAMARKGFRQAPASSSTAAASWKQRLHSYASRLKESLTLQRDKLRQQVSPTALTAPSRYHSPAAAGDNPMPCDTWWNPFCCAAEMCADMMVMMIDMMASGADAMTEVCEDIVDEIGKLADDIVHTEENIVLMGEEIGYMSNCIVVFINEGLDFVEAFCPAAKDYYSDPSSSHNLQSSGGDDACVDSNRRTDEVRALAASSTQLLAQEFVATKVSPSLWLIMSDL